MRTQSRLGNLGALALLVGGLLLASCAVLPAAGPSSPATSEVSTGATKPYGSLTIAVDLTAGRLDPMGSGTATYMNATAAIFDSLVDYDAKDQLRPVIAERWEIAPDGKTHTFHIRKGVKFHDGSDLTAADVKFSLETQMAPASLNTRAPQWRAEVSKVELRDDYTVVLQMKNPQFELLEEPAFGMYAVFPKKYIEEKGADYFAKHLIGSGPWKVVSYQDGVRVELEANENYWSEAPKFKNITLLNVREEGTIVAMLKTGELDLASVGPDSVSGLKSAGLRVLSYDGGAGYYGYVWYDLEDPKKHAVGDVRVRKALQLALDRKEMAGKLLGGNGAPYALFNTNPFAYYFDPVQVTVDPYDPEQAKKLLAEAGYPSGFNTKVWDVGGGGPLSLVNQAIAGYWRKIGVNAELAPIDIAALMLKYRPKPIPELWNTYYTNMIAGPRGFEKMAAAYHSTKGIAKNLSNPRLDQLIDKVPQTADPAEKKRLAAEATLLAKSEYSTLALMTAFQNLGLSSKIGDVTARARGRGVMAAMFQSITHTTR